jgi:hypothetical protein
MCYELWCVLIQTATYTLFHRLDTLRDKRFETLIFELRGVQVIHLDEETVISIFMPKEITELTKQMTHGFS